jgi:protein phosphatase
LNVYSDTNIGLTRDENQDRVRTAALCEDAVFAVVCDGMGGENAGSEASERAIGIIYDRITKVYRPGSDSASIKNLLNSSINTANAVIYDLASSSSAKKGMGTTCVAVLRVKNKLHIMSVGDSRVYVINGKISQITKDHSVVMQLYENGEISKEEIKNHPRRNYITKAIGVSARISPDYFELDVSDDTVAVLCSDGLSNHCEESEIFRAVKETAAEDLPAKLVSLALDGGGLDNITVAVISR